MSGSARYQLRAAAVTALQALTADGEPLEGVAVDYGWSGELRTREEIFLGETTGALSVPVFHGPATEAAPVTYDDRFGFTVYILAWSPGQTAQVADARADALALVVLKVFRETPTLNISDDHTHVVAALIAEQRSIVRPSKEGFTGQVEIDVSVHARIAGPAEPSTP